MIEIDFGLSFYTIVVLEFLSKQSSPVLLSEIVDAQGFCTPSDDWDMSIEKLRYLIKPAIKRGLIVVNQRSNYCKYEISEQGKNFLSQWHEILKHNNNRSWEK